MEKQIVVSNEGRQFLMKAFDCTRVTVWKALNFKSNTDTARKIRHLALQRGGELVGSNAVEWDTNYVEGPERKMVQCYGDRVRIELVRATNVLSVYVDDILERELSGLSIAELMELQQELELLAASL